MGPKGPGLKNEMMLPAVLDPWAVSALYEAANLAAKNPGSKVWLRSLGAEAEGQQGGMNIPQEGGLECVGGEAAAGDDDHRAEGELRVGCDRRAGGRICRCARHCGCAYGRDQCNSGLRE